jgi:hypothetical protein
VKQKLDMTGAACENAPASMSTGRSSGRVGHNLHQEAPQAFAKAIVDVDSY